MLSMQLDACRNLVEVRRVAHFRVETGARSLTDGVHWQLLISAASLLVVARIVEPIWGSKEFLKFISIVNLGTGAVALAVLYVWYIITSFRERAGKVL